MYSVHANCNKYFLFTANGDPLPIIDREDNIRAGDCYSYSISDSGNSTHTDYQLQKRAINCSAKPPAVVLVCQREQPGKKTATRVG